MHVTRKSWQTLVTWLYEVLISNTRNVYGRVPFYDETLIIAVAGVIRNYYEKEEWDYADAQLVGICAWRLVVGFTDGEEYTHDVIEALCVNTFTIPQIKEYQFKVWESCGSEGRTFDLCYCLSDYKKYHETYSQSVPKDHIVMSVMHAPQDNIEGYISHKVTFDDCHKSLLKVYEQMGKFTPSEEPSLPKIPEIHDVAYSQKRFVFSCYD